MENFRLFDYKDCFKSITEIEVINIHEQYNTEYLYTIAIPTFKRARDLESALHSVFNQKGNIPFNLMVVDNNPERNDETEKLLSDMKYLNLSYYKNAKNIGMAGNWNRIMSLCKTKYLVMLHDDDYLFPNYIQFIADVLEKYPTLSSLNVSKQPWDGLPLTCFPKNDLSSSYGLIEMKKCTNYYGFFFSPPSGCVFNVADVIEVGGFDPYAYPSIDYVLIEKLILLGKKVMLSRNKLLMYRIVNNATSQLDTQLKWLYIDEQIKKELGDILHLPKWYQKFVIYMVLKVRLRGINKIDSSFRYKGMKGGGYLYLVFMKLWNVVYKIYFKLI